MTAAPHHARSLRRGRSSLAAASVLLAAVAPLPAAAQQIDWAPVRRAVDAFPGYPSTQFAVLVGELLP